MVANSLVASHKAVAAATQYNQRVVECRVACLAIGRALGLPEWRSTFTLRQLQERLDGHPQGGGHMSLYPP